MKKCNCDSQFLKEIGHEFNCSREEKIIDEIVTNAISQIRPEEARSHYYNLVTNNTRKEIKKIIAEVLEQSRFHGNSEYCGRCEFIVSELKKI